MIKRGKLIIFSAPSGAGKSTLVTHLINSGFDFKFSISATSRPPRGNEQNGVEYHFMSPDEFRKRIENNEFIEYEEVYPDRFYGTLKAEVENVLNSGANMLFDVDVVGGCRLKEMYGDQALSIFVQPPSIEVLEERLRGRATDSEEMIAQRIGKAKWEMEFAPKFDLIIVNDTLELAQEKTVNAVNDFITKS